MERGVGVINKKSNKLLLAAVTLGCPKNRVDTEEILGHLASGGYIFTDDCGAADVLIVNTCGFIEEAQQEAIDVILKYAADPHRKEQVVLVAGCLVELYGAKLLRLVPEINGAIGAHSYHYLDRVLRMLLQGRRVLVKKPAPVEYGTLGPRLLTAPPHSVAVRIADGCSNRCAYCLIPSIRGPYRSRAPEEIVEEIRELVAGGTKEIVLVAQDTTAYGSDLEGGHDLCDLLEMIMALEPHFWVRIMYAYPSRVDERLASIIASEERICNYLDLPIQHVSERVLRLMGRPYGRDELSGLQEMLRRVIPGVTLRTTIMVGAPGENGAAYRELLDYLTNHHFEKLGAFTYSRQRGTRSYEQAAVSRRVAAKRLRTLLKAQEEVSLGFNRRLVGGRLTVLVDKLVGKGGSCYYGRSEFQAPDVDGGVYFRSRRRIKPGTWVSVRVVAASSHDLLAAEPVLMPGGPPGGGSKN